MKILFLFSIFSISPLGHAEIESKPVASARVEQNSFITYELRELKPAGMTQYTSGNDVLRQYFDFQNEQGNHHIIYEELASTPPARTVQSVRQLANSFENTCSMDIECSSKAFCTGDCRHMYYEVANAPGDAFTPDRNKCKVIYFSCEKASAAQATLVAPAPLAPSPPNVVQGK